MLSFSDVEHLYEITYEPQHSFTVHLPARDIQFHQKNKLYVADFGIGVDSDTLVTQAYT
jgi:hypothetical protein